MHPIKSDDINDTCFKSGTKVEHVKSEDFNETAFKSEPPDQLSTKLVSHDRYRYEEPQRSENRRWCFNCGSASHILRDCRVPPAALRRSQNRAKCVNVDQLQKTCSCIKSVNKHAINTIAQVQLLDQKPLHKAAEIYLEANIGQDKTSVSALLDSGSNCNVISRRSTPQTSETFVWVTEKLSQQHR